VCQSATQTRGPAWFAITGIQLDYGPVWFGSGSVSIGFCFWVCSGAGGYVWSAALVILVPAPCGPCVPMVTCIAPKVPPVIKKLLPASANVVAARRTVARRHPTVAKVLRQYTLCILCAWVRARVSALGCTVNIKPYNHDQARFTRKNFYHRTTGSCAVRSAAACCGCPHAVCACEDRVNLGYGRRLGACGEGSRSWKAYCVWKLNGRQFGNLHSISNLPTQIREAPSRRAINRDAVIACGTSRPSAALNAYSPMGGAREGPSRGSSSL
jgi:hypothetical protein